MEENTFAKDVKEGLSAPEKYLSSKYFYDDEGSRIFREIMEMPEYYLTNCEFDIFSQQAEEIFDAVNFDVPFDLVELGAGDGLKTAELIRYLIADKKEFTYVPVDISQEANDILSAKLTGQFPELDIQPRTGDYFNVLKENRNNPRPTLLLFIGSNIGNYKANEALSLLELFYSTMKKGDKLLIGVDLKKNPLVINQAYADPHGITKRFNLNLLRRINRELSANFNMDQFDFYAYYNPDNGEVKSYIVSLCNQHVDIKETGISVELKKGETIWTELSKKYDPEELNNLAGKVNFKPVKHFTDADNYFLDGLYTKVD